MSLNVPLSVVLRNSRVERNITPDIEGLTFRSAIPRGYASIKLALSRPLRLRPAEVDYYTSVLVYNNRNGQVVWEGRLEDPERHTGLSGQRWGLTAIGGAAHASDRTFPYIVVDKGPQRWSRIAGTSNILETAGDSKLEADDGFRLQFRNGSTAAVADHGGVEYRYLDAAGQKLGRVSYSYKVDNGDSRWRHRLLAINGGSTTVSNLGFNLGDGSLAKIVGTDWTNGRDIPQIKGAVETSSITVADELARFWLTNMVVRSMLLDQAGNDRLPTGSALLDYAYSTNTVLAEDVVRDLLGRVLPKYDKSSAKLSIAASTYAIDQLAYPDGITAEQVFSDLMLLEPNTFWAVWESNTSGLYRYEWATWPTSVDYEATVWGGLDSPASAVDLFDEVLVRYKGRQGAIRTVTRTLSVPQLTDAGLTRTGYIDLGDEPGGQPNAQQAGDLFLSDHQYPPNRGTLTVDRPIVSRSEGRMVQPFEIRPGRLIAVQDIEPTVDALNATTRDGVTVFRVVSVDYDADSNTAQLELDSYARSTAQALAALQKNPALVRRRR